MKKLTYSYSQLIGLEISLGSNFAMFISLHSALALNCNYPKSYDKQIL